MDVVYNQALYLYELSQKERRKFFSKDYWHNKLMSLALKDGKLRLNLFHLIDVLPTLKNDDEIVSHVKEYLFENSFLKTASFLLSETMLSKLVKMNVVYMGKRFIIGENILSAHDNLLNLYKAGFTSTIDLLGEKTLSEEEADIYFRRYQELIRELPKIIFKPNVSLKISALSSKIKEASPNFTIDELKKRVIPLLLLAKETGVFINFDIENFSLSKISYELFLSLIKSKDFKDWPHLGIVVQAYLLSSKDILEELIALAKKRGVPITIRLVKGAYWDYEVQYANINGFTCPVYQEKAFTDYNYESLSLLLLNNIDYVRPAFGSHNIRTLANAITLAKEKNIKKSQFEIQMLYGMGTELARVLLKQGFNVRIYTPIGEMISGMAYLVRRLLENTSQTGFLRLSSYKNIDKKELLSAPRIKEETNLQKEMSDWKNEGFLDFTTEEVRNKFNKALNDVGAILPISAPIIIDNKKYYSDNTQEHYRGIDKKKTTIVNLATLKEADLAIEFAFKAFSDLANISLEERRKHLENLSDILLHNRYFLAALVVHETSKTWAEADADVCEAIDYCGYYSLRAKEELSPKKLHSLMGEENTLYFNPRGVGIVIAPWNFPLAILCGMSVSLYVAGNSIILKPSERSSATAYYLYEYMLKAGFLKSAIAFLPGEGSKIGSYLVEHEKTALISFTGSKEVGHDIYKRASAVHKNQLEMKKVILEMGGKNAVIIDSDADVDEAIKGIIQSAFSYAGQKCSALSRLILLEDIKDSLISRLKGAVDSINIGSPLDASSFMGPVIDERAQIKLLEYIAKLKNDPAIKIIYEGKKRDDGFYVPIIIAETNDVKHWLMQEELFGPILCIFVVKDVDEAIDVANNSRFGLTGGFYSRSPNNIEKVKKLFNVGNLYINQKCVGAMVGRQPFGGFKMSGTGLKAGGPNHLFNMVNQKVVTINTLRQGFVPELLS